MSDKHDYVKEEANTPAKMTQQAFDFADRVFAHLDHLQLDLADQIDFGCSYNYLAYSYSPFETIRVTLSWLNRPWLDDPSQPVGVITYAHRSYGIPTFNKALMGQDAQGRWVVPSLDASVVQCEAPYDGWYVSAGCREGNLYIQLPRCVLQSAKYLKKIKALLRQPAWYGSRTDATGYCTYTGQWFNMLNEDSGNTAPELFNPQEHYWFTSDRPYAENPGRSVIPQAALGFGSLMCSKGCVPLANHSVGQFRADDSLWKMREWARLAKGVYNKLPDRVLEALDMGKLAFAYPHLAVQDDHTGMIAYTRDEAAGIRDRQLVMKPGRFIKQFARNPDICDDDVKYLAAEACGTVEIKFHRTRDRKEYSRVYQRGPQSCMAYGPLAPDTFDGNHLQVDGEFVHPTEIYAHPDNHLELVYGVIGTDNIVARTLVNTAKKSYCSIYVKDSPATARPQMERYLKDQGFTYSEGVLEGEKLLLIETDDRSIISPYLDPGNVGVSIDRVNNCLIAGGGDNHQADHSTGTLQGYTGGSREDDWSCDCCGDDYEEGDDYEHDRGGNRICRACIHDSYISAYVTGDSEECYVRDGETLHSCRHVNSGGLQDYSYVFFNSSRRDISYYDCVELDTSRYSDNGRPMIASIEDAVEDDDGNWVLRDDLDTYGLFIDTDGDAHPIEEWAAVTDEDGDVVLMELEDMDDELYDQAPANHEDWPMLPFFILKAVPDEEPVNVLSADGYEDECPDQSVA
jgi:hypothetical protein